MAHGYVICLRTNLKNGFNQSCCFLFPLVLTTDELDPLSQPLPVHGPSIVLETTRLIAEIRTRTCQLVNCYNFQGAFTNDVTQAFILNDPLHSPALQTPY